MKRKVVFIVALLSPEAAKMKDDDIEAALRLYLKPEDIPLCDRIEKITILSEG